MNAAELAQLHGLTLHAARKRIQRRTPLDRPQKPRRRIERPVSIAEQARRTGLPYEVVKKRESRGIPMSAPYKERPHMERITGRVWPVDSLNSAHNQWLTTAAPVAWHNIKARI